MKYYQWNGPYGEQGDKGGEGRTEKHTKSYGRADVAGAQRNKGVMRARRERKREEAEDRNARTLPERTRAHRRVKQVFQELLHHMEQQDREQVGEASEYQLTN